MTLQPQSRTNVSGTVATFSASAAGSAPLSYQWQFNGANLSGATAATLVLGNVQAGDAGNYTLVAANWGGAVTSAVAVLNALDSSRDDRTAPEPHQRPWHDGLFRRNRVWHSSLKLSVAI